MTDHLAGESGQVVCGLCEQVPPQPDDIFCAPCRADLDDMADEVVDPVEKVLAAHRRLDILSDLDRQECGCGWTAEGGPALHRRHVAAYIYDALELDGPAPWVLGPKSSMKPLMDAATAVEQSGRQLQGGEQ